MSKQQTVQRDCVQVPQVVHIITYGHDMPDDRYPRKCLVCRKLIMAGDAWQADDNGEYIVIQHSACIGVDTDARLW